MDIKKELENRLLGEEMTLLEMDDIALNLLGKQAGGCKRDSNGFFLATQTTGKFTYITKNIDLFDVVFEVLREQAKEPYKITLKVTCINKI